MGFPSTNNLPAVNQYDVNRSIISPVFLGQDYMNYMSVLPNIKGTTKIDHFGSLTKITKGFNAVKIGKKDEIKEGTFNIPKSIDITFDDRQIEIPARLVMPIGKSEPEIKIR